MEVVDYKKVTTSDNWNVNSLDVSSLKIDIKDDIMEVVISSPDFSVKDCELKINNGILFLSVNASSNSFLKKSTKFILPNRNFNTIRSSSFVKGQLRVILSCKQRQLKKNNSYHDVA